MQEYIRRCCSRSLVTGIHHSIFPMTIDRRCDDLDYELQSVIFMEDAWNTAKATIKNFKTNAAFQAHREDVRLVYDGISDTQAALICLRIYVEILIRYQCGILNLPHPACL